MTQTKAAAVDIQAMLAGLPVLHGRTVDTPDAAEEAAFAQLAEIGNGAVFAGRFDGDSAWERHPNGDELVHILEGETELTILTEAGEKTLTLKGGMLTVVPQGHWHRFHAPRGVTVLTATPQPTEISTTTPKFR